LSGSVAASLRWADEEDDEIASRLQLAEAVSHVQVCMYSVNAPWACTVCCIVCMHCVLELVYLV
jgi:hypothetical protein